VLLGPLPHDQPESGHRKQAVWTGIVIGSMPDKSWLVLWDPTSQATIHSYCSIKFLEYSTFTEVKLREMRQRFLPPQNAVVQLQSTSAISTLAAAVDQEGAALVSVAEVSAAPNEAILQLPPAAATMPEEVGNAEGNQANNATLDIVLNPPDDEPPQEEVEEVPADPDGEESEQMQYDGGNNCFVGLDNFQEGHDEHCRKWILYVQEKSALIGATVSKGQGLKAITWKVRDDVEANDVPPDINKEYREVGICGFDFTANNTKSFESVPERVNLMSLLIHLWPGDWRAQIQRVNDVIDNKNDENAAKIRKLKKL